VPKRDVRHRCRATKVGVPVCATLLTESATERTRHPAIILELSETGGKFSSPQRVVSGEAIGIILHPDFRYAIRGNVAWTRRTEDHLQFEFGVAFEEVIPESFWDILEQIEAA